MPIPSFYRPRVSAMRTLRASILGEINGARQVHGPCQFSRWQMVDTDFYSYFCIYLFSLCRGMNEPLLPKAITAWAKAHFYADVTFLPFLQNKKTLIAGQPVTNVAQVNCIVPFSI